MTTAQRLYDIHILSKDFERVDLFRLLVDKFKIQRALYPGSFVHISPSFVIPSVTYIDNDRRCHSFFADPATTRMVKERKHYNDNPEIAFCYADYFKPIDEEVKSFDLLISQWAGPVSQACKRYLKIGGILLANNSHGDASLASLDRDYLLAAVIIRRGGKYQISDKDLGSYFVPKSGRLVKKSDIERTGRGVSYTKSPVAYIFKRMQ